MMRKIAIAALLTASTAQAANFFPLSSGNHWTYQSDLGERFEITVGFTPIMNGGRVYHKVTGYATQPLHVRAEGDKVFWLNEEQGREEILTNFVPFAGGFDNTPISAPCEQDAQAQERPAEFQGGGMEFPAREIRYRVYGCADTGVENELYVDNLGLVRRVVQTIAGPRVFSLISAKAGPVAFEEQPGVRFRVSTPSSVIDRQRRDDAASFEVNIQLRVDRTNPVRLRYRTTQRYDVAVKDEQGEVVYLWSSTALFAQVAAEEHVVKLDYAVPLSIPLPDGNYQVEAWLTTDARERQFAATMPLSVVTASTTSAAGIKAARSRSSK